MTPTRRNRGPRRQPVARVVWPDGTESQAATWADMLERLCADQWDEELADDYEMREEMGYRAKQWSGTRIDYEYTNPREFFRELERARLLIVMEDPDADD